MPVLMSNLLKVYFGKPIRLYCKYYRNAEKNLSIFNIRAAVLYKVRIASILNDLKRDPFYTHLVSVFAKEFSM